MTDTPRPALPLRRLAAPLALALLAIAAVLISGCGNAVPPNAVATVGGETIEKEEFDHWMNVAARSQQPMPGQAAQPMVPDAPGFQTCIAEKGKQPVPKGAKKPTNDEFKKQCQQEYDQLKEQVLRFLVRNQWIEMEAEARDIEVTDEEVRKRIDDFRKQNFPEQKAFDEFLKQSGQTPEDLNLQARIDVLQTKLQKQITEQGAKFTEADLRAYYDKNKERFGQPETRDLRVVLTQREAKARRAKQALDRGQSFAQVARRFSDDPTTRQQGGVLKGVPKGQEEKAFDDAVFGAERGEIVGPVKTQFGYYVFEVTKVTPAKQRSFEEVRKEIEQTVKAEREQKALETFVKDFERKYKEETNCAEGYVIPVCKGGPPEPTQQQVPGGGQGAPPPQGQAAPPPEESR